MTREELNLQLEEIEEKYKDKEIETPEGILFVYYVFKAGQAGWEQYFDRFDNTKKNFEQAKDYLLNTFGYCGRDSRLIAIKKCCLDSENEVKRFPFSR